MKKININSNIYSLDISELYEDEKIMLEKARDNVNNLHTLPIFRSGCTLKFLDGSMTMEYDFVLNTESNPPEAICPEGRIMSNVLKKYPYQPIQKILISRKTQKDTPFPPCGHCLELMKKIEKRNKKELIIILDSLDDSNIFRIFGIESLAPLTNYDSKYVFP